MTFEASRLMVLMTMPPQPRSYDLEMTRAFVPGGPEPRTKGFSNFIPLTVIERSAATTSSSARALPPPQETSSTKYHAERVVNKREFVVQVAFPVDPKDW